MMDQMFKNKLNWGIQVARGNILNAEVTHRFGMATVGTTFVPIADGLAYRTPQAGSATALRIKAGGNANDTAAGTGARSVRLIGLNATGDVVSETIATAGASASAATTAIFIRLFDAEVVDSGTYGTQDAGSHAADIVIENAAGGTDWATIPVNGFPTSNTSIASYTIPRGHTGFIEGISIAVEGAKLVDILMLSRGGVLDTAAPYQPVQRVQEWIGIANTYVDTFTMPLHFPELTDIGMLGKVSNGTAAVMVQMDILLLRNE
jgi:hypothetical protein